MTTVEQNYTSLKVIGWYPLKRFFSYTYLHNYVCFEQEYYWKIKKMQQLNKPLCCYVEIAYLLSLLFLCDGL